MALLMTSKSVGKLASGASLDVVDAAGYGVGFAGSAYLTSKLADGAFGRALIGGGAVFGGGFLTAYGSLERSRFVETVGRGVTMGGLFSIGLAIFQAASRKR